jgi:SAM-dependent methyltransferase
MPDGALYETIGVGYSHVRRADPRIAGQISRALGRARTVLNVGAGTGNYEPTDLPVIAVEPALAMIAQRPRTAAPVVQAVAEALPFRDDEFDATLALLTTHHWGDLDAGLRELRRVSRRQIILMNDPAVGRAFWLTEYFPEVLASPAELSAPTVNEICRRLPLAGVEPVPVPADCLDGFLCAYWNRPERYLDPAVRAGVSSLARLAPDAVNRGVQKLDEDLQSGRWDRRFGRLRTLAAQDYGYRLITAGAPK